MDIVKIILYIVLAIASLGLIVVVLMQQSSGGGMGGMLGGAAEAAFGKHRAKSLEAKLGTLTKIAAAVLFVLCFALTIIEKYGA